MSFFGSKRATRLTDLNKDSKVDLQEVLPGLCQPGRQGKTGSLQAPKRK